MFQCPANPDVGAVKSDNDLANWMIDQRAVADQCRDMLGNAGKIVNGNTK